MLNLYECSRITRVAISQKVLLELYILANEQVENLLSLLTNNFQDVVHLQLPAYLEKTKSKPAADPHVVTNLSLPQLAFFIR